MGPCNACTINLLCVSLQLYAKNPVLPGCNRFRPGLKDCAYIRYQTIILQSSPKLSLPIEQFYSNHLICSNNATTQQADR